IPPEERLLPHDEGDPPEVFDVALRWRVAEDVEMARRRVKEAGEHFQCRGLAGAVRAKEPDDLAGVDGKVDRVHGETRLRLAADDALEGGEKSGALFVEGICLGQAGRGDDRAARYGHGVILLHCFLTFACEW